VNRHALEVLEFEEAVRRVASRAGSELGRQAVRARRPSTERAAVRAELARVEAAHRLLLARPDWGPPLPPDVRGGLKILEREGGVLGAEDLLGMLRLLEAATGLREGLAGVEETTPEGSPVDSALPALRDALPQRPDEIARLERTVDDDGRIRDDATPELRAIRRRLATARSRLVRRLEGLLSRLPERIRVPDASVTIRDDRHVIPIRREGKSEVGGIIHGESGSGATLFVEPPLALEMQAEISGLVREESAEVRRILRTASDRLRSDAPLLRDAFDRLVDFDALWARALAARSWEATRPEILEADEEGVEIVEGRHPLLLEAAEGPVVPFFLSLDPGERALVVSGPNTGGKTVLLKSIGLTFLLAQSGILPPVGPGTRLPLLREIFADIGDEQSIEKSLSTYSAHLANAREILEGAGRGTLVLMDEMGTGTDPAEGAALARALLETLVERGARAVVTSHLGAMKRLDRPGSGIVNASLLFDPDRIEPTYHFRKGRPGRSYGLAIARRLGIPGPVLDRAEGYLEEGDVEVESLLEQLEVKERALGEALEEARKAREEAERRRDEARTREAELLERERTAEARAREEARQLLLEARAEVEEAIREVRGAGEGQGVGEAAAKRARRAVEGAAEEHRRKRPGEPGGRTRTGGEGHGDREPLEPGERVRVLGSGARGVVREVESDRVAVEVGGLRMRLPVADVERVDGGGGGRPEAKSPKSGEGLSMTPDLDVGIEADLRGLRVDEVELELSRALDGAIMGGLSELRIIHGKGTGAVKARVQELLRVDPRVEDFRPGRPGEGGGGVTVASFP
jgi:DNA mismatch repair protein MutS2